MTGSRSPAISVVIATHRRPGSLRRLLRSLSQQQLRQAGEMEVVVAIDGEDDHDSVAVATAFGARVVTHRHAGRAAVRNLGARRASGSVLLFLDDDVEAESGLVDAHLAMHACARHVVALGDYPVVLSTRPTAAERAAWAWWEDAHAERRLAGVLDATHVWAGNLSLSRELFDAVGGFDIGFSTYGSEDTELGARLLLSGAALRLVPGVHAWHHARLDVAEHVRRGGEEARSHARLVARHPELAPFTPLSRAPRSRIARFGRRAPRRAHLLGVLAARAVPAADAVQLRRLACRLLAAARDESYWRAARAALAGRMLDADPVVLTIDVACGVPDELPSLPRGGDVRVALVRDGAFLASVPLRLDPLVSPRIALIRSLAVSPAVQALVSGAGLARADRQEWQERSTAV